MANVCSICRHQHSDDINRALLDNGPLRSIADQYEVSKTALIRHRDACLPTHLVKAQQAQEVLDANKLIAHLQSLRAEMLGILAEAKQSADSAMILKAIQRAEHQLHLGAELLGLLRSRVDLNVCVIKSWADIRDDELTSLIRESEALMRTEEVKGLPPERRPEFLRTTTPKWYLTTLIVAREFSCNATIETNELGSELCLPRHGLPLPNGGRRSRN